LRDQIIEENEEKDYLSVPVEISTLSAGVSTSVSGAAGGEGDISGAEDLNKEL